MIVNHFLTTNPDFTKNNFLFSWGSHQKAPRAPIVEMQIRMMLTDVLIVYGPQSPELMEFAKTSIP